MQRRGFLAAMLAAASAPAIVKAGSLMRINPKIIAPEIVGASTISLTGGFLLPGDIITIAGTEGSFRVATKASTRIFTLEQILSAH